MRRIWLFALLATSACYRDPIGSELDRLEAALAITPAQRPAWEAFRREAAAASGREAFWELREAAAGPHFDARRARTVADEARARADRVIDAWESVDKTLSASQRAALRRAIHPEG